MDLTMTTEEIDKVVQGERRLAEYPLDGPPDDGICNCPELSRATRPATADAPGIGTSGGDLGPEELARILEGMASG